MPKMTTRTTPSVSVADYLTNQLNVCGKKQNEIAYEIGYDKPNIITMFKQGLTKVPVSKAGPLGKAIGSDPVFFVRLVLREYMPETFEAIEEYIGSANSENENEILEIIRAANEGDPKVATAAQKKELIKWAKSL